MAPAVAAVISTWQPLGPTEFLDGVSPGRTSQSESLAFLKNDLTNRLANSIPQKMTPAVPTNITTTSTNTESEWR